MPNYYNPSGTQSLDFSTPVNNFITAFNLARSKKDAKKQEELEALLEPIKTQLANKDVTNEEKQRLIASLPAIYKGTVGLHKGMEEGFQKLVEFYKHANENYVDTGDKTTEDAVQVTPETDPNSEAVIGKSEVPVYKQRGQLTDNDIALAFQKHLMAAQGRQEVSNRQQEVDIANNAQVDLLKKIGYQKNGENVYDTKGQAWEVYTNPHSTNPDTQVVYRPLGDYRDERGNKLTAPVGTVITESTRNAQLRGGKVGAKHDQILRTAMNQLGFDPNKPLTSEQEEQLQTKVNELYAEDFKNTQTLKTSGISRNETSTQVGQGIVTGTTPLSPAQKADDQRAEQKRIEDYTVKLSEAQGILDGLESENRNLSNRRIRQATEIRRLIDQEKYDESDSQVVKAREEMQQIENALNENNTKISRERELVKSIHGILGSSSSSKTNSSTNTTTYTPAQIKSFDQFRQANAGTEFANWTNDQIHAYLQKLATGNK